MRLGFTSLLAVITMITVCFGNLVGVISASIFDSGGDLNKIKYMVCIACPLSLLAVSRAFRSHSREAIVVGLFVVVVAAEAVHALMKVGAGDGQLMEHLQFLLAMPLIFLTGYGLASYVDAGRLLSSLCKLWTGFALLAALYGFLEMSLGSTVWGQLNLRAYYLQTGMPGDWVGATGLPLSWWSWDLVWFFGDSIRRMVSYFMDPVGLSRFFGIYLCLYFGRFIKRTPISLLASILSCVGMALTIAKGGVFIVFVYMICRICKERITTIVVGLFMALAIMLVASGHGKIMGPSFLNHVSSIVYSSNVVSDAPFGRGMSVDDVQAMRGIVSDDIDSGFKVETEGSLSLYVVIMGYVGLALYISLFYAFFPLRRDSDEIHSLKQIVYVILLSSIAAHSAFSIVGGLILLLPLGVYVGQRDIAAVMRSDRSRRIRLVVGSQLRN